MSSGTARLRTTRGAFSWLDALDKVPFFATAVMRKRLKQPRRAASKTRTTATRPSTSSVSAPPQKTFQQPTWKTAQKQRYQASLPTGWSTPPNSPLLGRKETVNHAIPALQLPPKPPLQPKEGPLRQTIGRECPSTFEKSQGSPVDREGRGADTQERKEPAPRWHYIRLERSQRKYVVCFYSENPKRVAHRFFLEQGLEPEDEVGMAAALSDQKRKEQRRGNVTGPDYPITLELECSSGPTWRTHLVFYDDEKPAQVAQRYVIEQCLPAEAKLDILTAIFEVKASYEGVEEDNPPPRDEGGQACAAQALSETAAVANISNTSASAQDKAELSLSEVPFSIDNDDSEEWWRSLPNADRADHVSPATPPEAAPQQTQNSPTVDERQCPAAEGESAGREEDYRTTAHSSRLRREIARRPLVSFCSSIASRMSTWLTRARQPLIDCEERFSEKETEEGGWMEVSIAERPTEPKPTEP
ncbi:unnamed protein product [Vitrella brassicaformis CCMP3155]|uniref:Uncharacterized protein n=1 Tax=Vitrella brassicaformis (strain CCMP3155) TaxID=1169540 RepID=A0A0G4EL64_VITBC|nr:unnamed protein product [Vitrella brassicaformis CCMP3155]|eukprot:CEL98151.1 unnamed protein product [Vitrella brassicaformis CCMP3155]